MPHEELEARILAVIAAVAASGRTDVGALLADLSPADTVTVVHGLAELALRGVMPGRMNAADPAAREWAAQVLRGELLRRAGL